jgi:hypothetical protein
MFSLVHAERPGALLRREAPPLAAALIIAELFYKFHSFSLECLAFLATWYLLGALFHRAAPPRAR